MQSNGVHLLTNDQGLCDTVGGKAVLLRNLLDR